MASRHRAGGRRASRGGRRPGRAAGGPRSL